MTPAYGLSQLSLSDSNHFNERHASGTTYAAYDPRVGPRIEGHQESRFRTIGGS